MEKILENPELIKYQDKETLEKLLIYCDNISSEKNEIEILLFCLQSSPPKDVYVADIVSLLMTKLNKIEMYTSHSTYIKYLIG